MKRILVLGMTLTALACAREPAPEQAADSIYFGGEIVTHNAEAAEVEAVAVKQGRVVDLGTFDAIHDAHAGPRTRMIDLHGGVMFPGVVEAPETADLEAVMALARADASAGAPRRIAVGEIADFAILDHNPLVAGEGGPRAVRVIRTIREGETDYRAEH